MDEEAKRQLDAIANDVEALLQEMREATADGRVAGAGDIERWQIRMLAIIRNFASLRRTGVLPEASAEAMSEHLRQVARHLARHLERMVQKDTYATVTLLLNFLRAADNAAKELGAGAIDAAARAAAVVGKGAKSLLPPFGKYAWILVGAVALGVFWRVGHPFKKKKA